MQGEILVRSGGFRSRVRVQWARAGWSLLRSIPSELQIDLPERFWNAVDWARRKDRMFACPHLPEMHWSSTRGFVDCAVDRGGCGLCLKGPSGWRVECARTPDDGLSWERAYAKPGWEERWAAKGLL